MRAMVRRAALWALLLSALTALWAESAPAQPGTGPRETVDQRFTTTSPNSPTGIRFTGSFHAANDRKSPPPFLRRIVFDPPGAMRYDTSVPAQCTATDAELQALGPAAC